MDRDRASNVDEQYLKSQLRKIARDIVGVEQRINVIERVSQSPFRSVSGGSTVYYDEQGEVRQIVGAQPDGSYTTVDVNGPPAPSPPSTPIIETRTGSVIVSWDGKMSNGSTLWPNDFSHIEVHIATYDDFVVGDGTEIATFPTRTAGSISISLEPETMYWLKLVQVNTSNIRSLESDEVEFFIEEIPYGIQTYRQDDAPTDLGPDDFGAIWYDTNDGNRQRFWDGTVWVDVSDENIDEALAAAEDALAKAHERVKLNYDTARPTGLTSDDRVLWMNPNNGYAAEYWNGVSWSQYFFGPEAVGFDARDIGGILTAAGLTPPSTPQVGDIWFNSGENNRPERWDGTQWVVVQDLAIQIAASAAADAQTAANNALTAAEAAQATADGSIRTHYQSTPPWPDGSTQPTSALGDMWFDQDTGQAYRWNGSAWILIEDSSIAVALAAAQNAQSTADGKINSYYSTTPPTLNGEGDPLSAADTGDLWFDIDDGNKQYYWDGNSWEPLLAGLAALANDVTLSISEAVKTYTVEYAVNSSETVAPTAGWSTAQPTRTAGTFIWFRTTVTRNNNTTSTTSPALLTGNTGATGAAAGTIVLTATAQVLTSPAAGGATNPTTTTVTGTAQNTTITAWDYSVNGAAFSTTVPAGVSRTGNVVTITGSTMTARTIAVRMGNGGSIADTLTVAKVLDGAQGSTGGTGADGYTVLLTNESHTFAGSTTAALAGSTTSQVVAFKGQTQQSATIGTITGQVTGLTTAVTNNGTTTAGFTVTVTTALAQQNGELVVPITVDGVTFSKRFTWAVTRTGSQGIQGPSGSDGATLYTWIKYADTPTSGMADLPTGKTYMGIAYNKPTASESAVYSDYEWSLIQGPQGNQGIQGPSGADGQPTYTWIKYGDSSAGAGLSDTPTGKTYIGIAYNKPTATESAVPTDYEWSLIQGPPGADAATISLTATAQVLTVPAAGGATSPTTSTVTGAAVNTTITAWTYSVDGAAFSATVPAGVSRTGNVVTVTGTTMTARTIAVRMADASGVADTITVARVLDGATGGSGAAGADGYTVLLTNEANVFAGSTTAALAGSTTSQIIAYKGATQIAATIGTITGQVTGLTTAVTNNGTTTAGFTVTVTTSLTATSGELTIPVTVDGQAFTKKFAWSVARTGATGATGVSITAVTPYYAQLTTGSAAPAKPTAATPPAPWTATEPTYASNTELYRTEKITFSNATFAYTDVFKSSAYAAAVAAMTVANTKITTYSGSTDPGAAANGGDLWLKPEVVNSVSVNTLYRRNDADTAWVKVDDPASQQAIADAAAAAQLADGKMSIFPQDAAPTGLTAADNGDLWIDTNDGNKMYRYVHGSTAGTNGAGGSGPWISVLDTSLASIQYVDQQILISASGKNKSTYSTGVPGTTANIAGDIWFQYNGSNQIIGQWRGTGGTGWTPVTLENSVIATVDAGKINTGFLDVANRIQAGSLVIGQVQNLQTNLDKAQQTANAAALEGNYIANPFFDDWSSTYPVGFNAAAGSAPVKETTITRTPPFSMRFNLTAGTNQYVVAHPTMPNYEYLTLTYDFYLVSGDVGGAGVLVRWNSTTGIMSDVANSINTDLPSPAPGVWHRVTKTIRRSNNTGTYSDMDVFVMGGWSGLGTITEKNIIFDFVALRPASSAEILAFNAPADATSKAATARTGAVDDLKTLWGHPSNTTLIDGGDIYTSSIRAKQLMLLDINNYLSDPNFIDNSTQSWEFGSGAGVVVAGGPTTPGYLSMNAAATNTNLHTGDASFWATEPGTEYQITGEYAGAVSNTGTTTFYPSLQVQNAANATISWPQTSFSVGASATWTPFTANLTMPTNASRMRWHGFINATVLNNKVLVRGLKIRRKNAGSLIVDGTIEAGKLAVNSVVAANIIGGEVTTDKLSSDAIDGKTITGAIIRTAAEGARLELTSSGLIQVDTNGNVILSIGDANKFTGEIDATGMIIRDSLQLFGRDNLFATGSRVTLKASTSNPSQAPTLSWDYAAGPDISNGVYWYPTATHSENGVFHSAVYVFLDQSLYRRADGKFWEFPQIPIGSTTRAEFKAWSMVRIAKADTGAERVVMIGEDWNRLDGGGFPETWMRVYDDSTMNTSGTVAPILKAQWKVSNFNWFLEYRLGRNVSGTTDRNKWILLTSLTPSGGGDRTLTYTHYSFNNDDATYSVITNVNLGAVIPPNQVLAGGAIGSRSSLQIDTTSGGSGTDLMLVVSLGYTTAVRNLTAGTWEVDSYWDPAWNSQERFWTDGSVLNGTMTNYYTHNWGAGSENIKTFKYTNSNKRVTTNVWSSYSWLGEASSGFATIPSPRSSIAYRRRARLRVTVPALPAPIAGVGQARNPSTDVYGWQYYIAQSSTNPANVYLGPNNPTRVPNTAMTAVSAMQETFPTNTGTGVPALSNFPASGAATIVSDNGSLSIDGNGDIAARDVDVSTLTLASSEVGLWFSYSPVLTSGTLGTGGTLEGRYTRIGDIVHFESRWTLGTGYALSSSSAVGVPAIAGKSVTTISQYASNIKCTMVDQSAGNVYLGFTLLTNNGCSAFYLNTANSALPISATVPFTWAAGDHIYFTGTYRLS